ncbi:MAG: hypothetical protein Q4G25_00850 [Paracoccus sp. (in: a-proteobacteria)]|nr:hypothetical protein [Paracoccus sp. (in: a-proteobacteria)]
MPGRWRGLHERIRGKSHRHYLCNVDAQPLDRPIHQTATHAVETNTASGYAPQFFGAGRGNFTHNATSTLSRINAGAKLFADHFHKSKPSFNPFLGFNGKVQGVVRDMTDDESVFRTGTIPD